MEKCGKDIWFLMILLFKDYNIKSQNCYTIHDVELEKRPLSNTLVNSVMRMVYNAMAIRDILPGNAAFDSKEGPSGITDCNLTIVRSLSSFSLEIDEERHYINQSHWRCYVKRADVSDNYATSL